MSHDFPELSLSNQLPPPSEIATYYDRLLEDLDGEYIRERWESSAIQRRHYRQTELAIRYVIDAVPKLGDVLEIGCGPAVWTPLFLDQARRVSLLDISEGMLSHARIRIEQWEAGRHANKVNYTCGDFLELALPEMSYDTIVSSRAFEYMSDKQAFVTKCFTLLRPGGTLFVVTKNKGWHDLKKRARTQAGVHRKEMSVSLAMQLDLVGWQDAIRMVESAGLSAVRARPVVLGSYDWVLLASRPGLVFADFLHRLIYRRPIDRLTRFVDPIMESYSVVGIKRQ
jgi:ubiquinone/menaquinone biosynthesis C-methylase UbiE